LTAQNDVIEEKLKNGIAVFQVFGSGRKFNQIIWQILGEGDCTK
jgi:hypothetical protein